MPDNYEIIVKQGEKELTIRGMAWDSTIDEWREVFKAVLHWTGHHPDNIEELFNEEN